MPQLQHYADLTFSLPMKLGMCVFVCLVGWFGDRISLCGPGCYGIHYIDRAGFQLTDISASAF